MSPPDFLLSSEKSNFDTSTVLTSQNLNVKCGIRLNPMQTKVNQGSTQSISSRVISRYDIKGKFKVSHQGYIQGMVSRVNSRYVIKGNFKVWY